MNREGVLIKRVLLWATRHGWRLGRNSKGGAWQGKFLRDYPCSTKRGAGRIVELAEARLLQFGLRFSDAGGESDLIGWRELKITSEMVGRTVAQFVALELKTPNVKATAAQRNFVAQVRRAGGYAAIVRDRGIELEFDEGGQNGKAR